MESYLTVETIAAVCHEANKEWCEQHGDMSQPEWEDAPDWQRESAIKEVKYHLNHPDSKPEDSHNSWLEEKRENGWKYGKVKDPDKKEHPCFVPYDKLSFTDRKKDSLFMGVVRALEI